MMCGRHRTAHTHDDLPQCTWSTPSAFDRRPPSQECADPNCPRHGVTGEATRCTWTPPPGFTAGPGKHAQCADLACPKHGPARALMFAKLGELLDLTKAYLATPSAEREKAINDWIDANEKTIEVARGLARG
jgi:hypothetical protein